MSTQRNGITRRSFVAASATAALALGAGTRPAWSWINESGAGGLAPPSNGSFMFPIIKQLQLDKKHGLNFDVHTYSNPGALYSDFAANNTGDIFGAVFNAANFYTRGMDVRLLFTVSTANHNFVTKNSAIKTAKDLDGKTIAATTSSGMYGLALLFLRQNNLDPHKNINVITAAPSSVQTQLLADRVEVGLLADPALSNVVSKGLHIVGDMNNEIRKQLSMKADAPIWYIAGYAHKTWIDENPKRAMATMKMWQDAAAFHHEHQDEADKIVSDYTHIPVPALKLSRKLGLANFIVKPAIEEKANIDAVLKGFKEVGFLKELPDDGIYWKPQG
jgi:NitT/TauT family transport system substrate-binding protein